MNDSDFLFQAITRVLTRNKRDKQTSEIYSNGPALGTYKGKVRPENEDRLAMATIPPLETRPALFLAVLCDGLGGMEAGAECARDSIAYLVSTLVRSRWTNAQRHLRDSILWSNRLVNRKYADKSGSTLSAVLYTSSGELSAYNVGDSRIYSYGPSGIRQISSDDTLEKLLKGSPQATDIHPQIGRRLAQSMGMASIQLEELTLPSTDQQSGLFLSSDGAHAINQDVFGELALSAGSPLDFVDHVLALHSWSTAKDNASLVCLPLGNWLAALGKFWVADVVRLFTSYNEVFIPLPPGFKADITIPVGREADTHKYSTAKEKEGELFDESSTYATRKKSVDGKKSGRKPARVGKKKKQYLKVVQ